MRGDSTGRGASNLNTAPLAFRVLGERGEPTEIWSLPQGDPPTPTLTLRSTRVARVPECLRVPDRTSSDHLDATGSTAGYTGPVGVPYIHFDIDRPDLDVAIRDARRLPQYLADHYDLAADDLVVYFTGSKGFHVSVPTAELGGLDRPTTRRDAGLADRRLRWASPSTRASTIASGSGGAQQQAPETGLHKVRIDLDDLLYLDPVGVRRLAALPIPYDLPEPRLHPLASSPIGATPPERVPPNGPFAERATAHRVAGRVNPLTRSLMTDPTSVEVGYRHTTIFWSAADLAEFGSSTTPSPHYSPHPPSTRVCRRARSAGRFAADIATPVATTPKGVRRDLLRCAALFDDWYGEVTDRTRP